jgi:hypothetical protein
VKSTRIKAIKNGNFSSWQGLTEHAVKKHLSKSAATVKGYLNQQRMFARSTQPQKKPECTMASESNLDDGIKKQCIYSAVVDAGKTYTDQTGRFPVISSRGNVSIMILYEYDENAIMDESIKNNKAEELVGSFQVMEQKFSSRGLTPKRMTLDNEASKLLKEYLHYQEINFQLAPPYCHQINAAERAIRSFKYHLIAGLCSTDKALPMHVLDILLQQAILALNMLRTSRIKPKIYAATHLDGQYEYNRAPESLHMKRLITGAHGPHTGKMAGT